MKKQLFIYCAGGAGREIADIAERSNARRHDWASIRFVDDVIGRQGGEVIRFADFLALGIPADEAEFLIGNGEPAHRVTLSEKVKAEGYNMATLIDGTAVVAADAAIGAGTILYPGVCISPGVVIGENCLIYYHSNIAHDSAIGAHCVISIAASVSGHCTIGNACFIGAHCAVKEQVQVGERCILGMGCMLLQDAPASGVYAGAPARRMCENCSERVFK